MRIIGTFNQKRPAERLRAYLESQGIEADLREDEDEYSVWGLQEQQIQNAREIYQQFKTNPDDTQYNVSLVSRLADEHRSNTRHRTVDVRREVFGQRHSQNTVTWTCIIMSVVLTIMIQVPQYAWIFGYLLYSVDMGPAFYEISQGQVWRLVTPIFMHANLLHILFNMLWLHSFGSQIESNEGPKTFAIYIILAAAIVNTSQYIVSGGAFLGFSGVVYALFGFVWTNARYKAGGTYEMPDFTVKIMMFWLFFCLLAPLLPFMPRVANTQHFVGAGLGWLFGFIKSGGLKSTYRRWKYRQKLK